jgi:hypothetical protein
MRIIALIAAGSAARSYFRLRGCLRRKRGFADSKLHGLKLPEVEIGQVGVEESLHLLVRRHFRNPSLHTA